MDVDLTKFVIDFGREGGMRPQEGRGLEDRVWWETCTQIAHHNSKQIAREDQRDYLGTYR